MDSLKSVWQSILDEIAKNITSTAYNTWFSDCEPVELGETSLIIQTTSDFKRSASGTSSAPPCARSSPARWSLSSSRRRRSNSSASATT